MDLLIEKLHTAARRYCLDRYRYWAGRYAEIARDGRDSRVGGAYTREALDLFPRYNLLEAILVEIERSMPRDFSSLEEARELLGATGRSAEHSYLKAPRQPVAIKAAGEERDGFVRFVRTISAEELLQVEPLPYRRVLASAESRHIRSKLEQAWGIGKGYWYPLSVSSPANVSAFQDRYFQDELGPEKLRAILAGRGITNLWELREYGPEYELELSGFDPYYNGAEGFWCSEEMDWVIYASHESSVTVGGWLLAEVKKAWPNWEKRIWTTPFYD